MLQNYENSRVISSRIYYFRQLNELGQRVSVSKETDIPTATAEHMIFFRIVIFRLFINFLSFSLFISETYVIEPFLLKQSNFTIGVAIRRNETNMYLCFDKNWKIRGMVSEYVCGFVQKK